MQRTFQIAVFLLLLFGNHQTGHADSFIGQWHLFEKENVAIAQTIDGLDKLRIEVRPDNQVVVIFNLQNFNSFGTTDNVLEYASPNYGRIRTGNYQHQENVIILSDIYEVKRFIQTLCDISTHVMLAAENMGYSFTERKISIAYLDNEQPPTLKRSQFSTVEIDEVLEVLGLTNW